MLYWDRPHRGGSSRGKSDDTHAQRAALSNHCKDGEMLQDQHRLREQTLGTFSSRCQLL